ncbi:MAG: hypothetical protein ACRD3D_12695 [Terriglobia bacterium]
MSIETVVTQLKEERTRLDRAIEALESLGSRDSRAADGKNTASAATPARRKRGRLTAAGRRRLSELMTQRWAERRKQQPKKHGKG